MAARTITISFSSVPGQNQEDAARNVLIWLRERGLSDAFISDVTEAGGGWGVDVSVRDPWQRPAHYAPPATLNERD